MNIILSKKNRVVEFYWEKVKSDRGLMKKIMLFWYLLYVYDLLEKV